MSRRIAAVVALALLWPPAAGAQTPLAWKLQKGEGFTLSIELKLKDRFQIGGLDQAQDAHIKAGFDVTVRKTPAGGDLVLELKIASLALESSKAQGAAGAQLARAFAALKGSTFQATVDRTTKSVRFSGLGALAKKFAAADKPSPAAQAESMLKTMFRNLLGESFTALPAAATARGDAWKQTAELDAVGVGILLTRKTYTDAGQDSVQGRQLRKAGVKAGLEFKLDKEGNPLRTPGATIEKANLKEQQYTGTLYFDPKAGLPARLDSRLVLDLEVTMSRNGMTREAQIRREQTFTIRFGSKKKEGE
jgi:hypothetical protein